MKACRSAFALRFRDDLFLLFLGDGDLSGEVVLDEFGLLLLCGTIVHFRISSHSQKETALRLRDVRFVMLFLHAPIVVMLFDIQNELDGTPSGCHPRCTFDITFFAQHIPN